MKSLAEDDPRLMFLAEADADKAQGHCTVVRNAWWAVHPEKGLIFFNSKKNGKMRDAGGQYNKDKRVTDQVVDKLYPWAIIKQIPLVIYHAPLGG